MSLYEESFPQLIKMLKNLNSWLAEAQTYAEERGFDADVLVNARLAPDQFVLAKQVQSACDSTKFAASRLSGQEAPKHEDKEATIAELRARVEATLAYVEGFTAEQIEVNAEEQLFLPFLRGGSVKGADYLREFVVPNVYFHLVTAYSILRHNGVKLGKMAFLGAMSINPPKG